MLFFMFFQNPFLESILGGQSCQATLKNGISEPSLVPSGVQHVTLGNHFRPKSRLLSYPAKYFSLLWAPWGRPRRDLRPKTVQGHVFIDLRLTLAWFWTEFCQMLCRFWMLKAYLLCFFMDFQSPAGLYMQSLRTRPLGNNLRVANLAI